MLDYKMETFEAVAIYQSYTKAAEHLHITQPAVTQHIHKLEEHYHCKLIDFSGKSLFLTPAGEILIHYISLQKRNEQQLLAQLQGIHNPLNIGATLSIADFYLPNSLHDYLNQTEDTGRIFVGNTKVLLEKLLHGELDCAFIEGIFDKNLYQSKVFCHATFLPVVAKNHPLAGKTVSLEDIFQYPLLVREEGSGTRAILENFLEQHNASIQSFRKRTEIGSFSIIKRALQNTENITFLYEQVMQEEIADSLFVPLQLEGFPLVRPLYFVYLKNSLIQSTYEEFFHQLF